ncbi:uncharacterized protein LOC143259056 [Megalopta genalis]|uniref:uncharacterized protein LOC143259056 n=1 Tax=Megalopta genalis TaxID=115081 RepID=UPI003FD3DC7D
MVTILPFFLAAHVVIDENARQPTSEWQLYGPEWTYDVQLNLDVAYTFNDNSHSCVTMMSKMRCRPKGSDTLSCHFEDAKMSKEKWSEVLQECPVPTTFEPVNPAIMNDDPFEVRFNSRGIENLVIPRNISRARLDMLRDVVSQLHIGFEPEMGSQRFVSMESSSVGLCKVEVDMSRIAYTKSAADKNQQFEIVFEPSRPEITPLNRTALKIDKVRQMKKCPDSNIHFFEYDDNPDFENKNRLIDMTTSVSSMHISNTGLYAETESTGSMKALVKPKTLQIRQKISLTLKSVRPAKREMPEVVYPASTSLYGFRSVEL